MPRNARWNEGSGGRRRFERAESQDALSSRSGSWRAAAGVFIIQLTVPMIFYAYGVLLAYLLERRIIQLWHGLLPPTTYIVIRCFADPVCRKAFTGQNYSSKTTSIGGVLLITGGIAANGFFESVLTQVLTLGVLCGLCTSVVVTQAEAVLYCHFPSQRGIRQSVCQIASALGQFGVPLLMNGLIRSYGIQGGFVLQSGLILHGLVGAVLLSPPNDSLSDSAFIRRPRTYTVVNDVEMIEFPHSLDSGNSGHSPLLSSGRSWKNPGNAADVRYDVAQTSSPICIVRHKTVNGVDILPRIPEECEDSDNENSSDSNSSNNGSAHWHFRTRNTSRWNEKSFSRHEGTRESNLVSNRFLYGNRKKLQNNSLYKWKDITLHNENRNDAHTIKITPENTRDAVKDEENSTDKSTTQPSSDNITELTFSPTLENPQNRSSTPCCQQICQVLKCNCCNKTCFYECYIAILNIPNDLHFYVIVPFLNAVKVRAFFPSVFPCMLQRLSPLLFATFAPSLTRTRIPKSTFQEAAFTVSVAAFGLLCFTLLTPCLSGVKIVGQKFTYFFGCLLIVTGLYLLSSTRNHSYFVLGCACFGFGIGATTATVTTIIEADLGMRDFVRVQGPLDAVSGLFILLTAILLGFLLQDGNGVSHCFIVLIVLQLVTGIMWMLSLLKPLLNKIHCFPHSEWHTGGDFLTPS